MRAPIAYDTIKQVQPDRTLGRTLAAHLHMRAIAKDGPGLVDWLGGGTESGWTYPHEGGVGWRFAHHPSWYEEFAESDVEIFSKGAGGGTTEH